MTFKALGKPAPTANGSSLNEEHFRLALLEASEVLKKKYASKGEYPQEYLFWVLENPTKVRSIAIWVAGLLEISAGEIKNVFEK